MGDRVAALSLSLLVAFGAVGPARAQATSALWSAPLRPGMDGETVYVMPDLPSPSWTGRPGASPLRPPARASDVLTDMLDVGPEPPAPVLAGPPDETELPARPGAFKPDAVRIPGHFHKDPTIASRVGKDVELLTRDRTTLGVFGEVGPPKPGTVNPGWRDRALGGGMTFQYRFGTR